MRNICPSNYKNLSCTFTCAQKKAEFINRFKYLYEFNNVPFLTLIILAKVRLGITYLVQKMRFSIKENGIVDIFDCTIFNALD